MELSFVFLAAGVVTVVSLSGVIFSSVFLRSWMHRNLTYLATFAAGIFLVITYHLLEETFHHGTESLALGLGAIIFGFGFMEALHHLLPSVHHHHDTHHDHAHSALDGRRVLVSDSLHNIGDGFLLVASFAVSAATGFVATIGIILHELVQEVSEFFVLKEAGYSTAQALTRNFLASLTIFVGIGLALFLASAEEIVVLLSGLAAGGFLATLTRDLIPHMIRSLRKGFILSRHVAALSLGIILMLLVQTALPHEEHTEDSADEEHHVAHVSLHASRS